MILKCVIKVKGIELIADAQPGKPNYRLSIEGLEERKIVGCDEPELMPGNAKSFVLLEKGQEYLVEAMVGAYLNGNKAQPYMQIRKIIKAVK